MRLSPKDANDPAPAFTIEVAAFPMIALCDTLTAHPAPEAWIPTLPLFDTTLSEIAAAPVVTSRHSTSMPTEFSDTTVFDTLAATCPEGDTRPQTLIQAGVLRRTVLPAIVR